ncbi:MAG: hypothetical protein ACJ8G1_04585 [Vitreoscilla sp.]
MDKLTKANLAKFLDYSIDKGLIKAATERHQLPEVTSSTHRVW